MRTDTIAANVNTPSIVTPAAGIGAKGPDFGDGRYSGLMREAYSDARRLTTLSSERAEQFARDLGSDWGRTSPKVRATYGAATKDGRTTLKEVASAKGVMETKAITLGRILSRTNDLKKLTENTGSLEVAGLEVKIDVAY